MIVDKPWGHEEVWALTDYYAGKIIYINEGKRLSLQYHKVKQETIYVLEGTLELILDEQSRKHNRVIILKPGQYYHIEPYTLHRFCASQGSDVKVMEVSTTQLNDIVRIEDDYSRK